MSHNEATGQPASPTESHATFRQHLDRSRRYDVHLWAQARHEGDPGYLTVKVADISTSGCKIECMAPLDPAKKVLLRFDSYGQCKAAVMWSRVGAYGCKFDQKLSDAVIKQIVGEN